MTLPADPADMRSFPILYVDDEPANLETMSYVLGNAFQVHTCMTGPEALKRLASSDYAVLLADQRMPGMTGVEVCQRAREIAPGTVRVIVTAYADARAVEEAVNVGNVSRYIRKPHRAPEIARMMREAIEIHRGRRARREVEAYILRTAPHLAVRGIEAEVGQRIMRLIEPLRKNIDGLRKAVDGAAQTEALNVANASEALYGYAVRLSMGQPEDRSGRARLGSVTDATVRALRGAVERVAGLDVTIEGDPLVPLESAAASHIVVHTLAAAVDAIEAMPGDAHIELTLGEVGDVARLVIRYSATGHSHERGTREPPSFITVRHLVKEAGGNVAYESTREGMSIEVNLPTAT